MPPPPRRDAWPRPPAVPLRPRARLPQPLPGAPGPQEACPQAPAQCLAELARATLASMDAMSLSQLAAAEAAVAAVARARGGGAATAGGEDAEAARAPGCGGLSGRSVALLAAARPLTPHTGPGWAEADRGGVGGVALGSGAQPAAVLVAPAAGPALSRRDSDARRAALAAAMRGSAAAGRCARLEGDFCGGGDPASFSPVPTC
jgi:hypothetical protein